LNSSSFGFRHLRVTSTDGKKATRPCPCGYLGDASGRCRCTPQAIARYRSRVLAARGRQLARQGKPNAWLGPRETERHCAPDAAATELLRQAIARLALSARAYHRVLRVARSIADLAASEALCAAHVAEAIQYRRLDAAL